MIASLFRPFFLVCQSCFHIQCHENNRYNCPKCQRAKHRKFVKQIDLIGKKNSCYFILVVLIEVIHQQMIYNQNRHFLVFH